MADHRMLMAGEPGYSLATDLTSGEARSLAALLLYAADCIDTGRV
jgi:hypothetical protein